MKWCGLGYPLTKASYSMDHNYSKLVFLPCLLSIQVQQKECVHYYTRWACLANQVLRLLVVYGNKRRRKVQPKIAVITLNRMLEEKGEIQHKIVIIEDRGEIGLGWVGRHSQSNTYFRVIRVGNPNNLNLVFNPTRKIWVGLGCPVVYFFFFFCF